MFIVLGCFCGGIEEQKAFDLPAYVEKPCFFLKRSSYGRSMSGSQKPIGKGKDLRQKPWFCRRVFDPLLYDFSYDIS